MCVPECVLDECVCVSACPPWSVFALTFNQQHDPGLVKAAKLTNRDALHGIVSGIVNAELNTALLTEVVHIREAVLQHHRPRQLLSYDAC